MVEAKNSKYCKVANCKSRQRKWLKKVVMCVTFLANFISLDS